MAEEVNQPKSKPNKLAIIILVILVVGAGGWLAYRTWHKKPLKSPNTSEAKPSGYISPPSDNPIQTAPIVDGFYVIKDWGVKFKTVPEVKSLQYSFDTNKTVMLMGSVDLANSNKLCQLLSGTFTRGKATDHFTATGSPVATFHDQRYAKQVGDYYYVFIKPGGPCATNSAAAQQQMAEATALDTSIQNSLTSN